MAGDARLAGSPRARRRACGWRRSARRRCAPRPEPRTIPSRGALTGTPGRTSGAAAPPGSWSDARRCGRTGGSPRPGTMNSRRRWRQPPHGTQMSSESAITATSVICERPDATSAPIARRLRALALRVRGVLDVRADVDRAVLGAQRRADLVVANTARGRAPSRCGRRPRGRSSRPPGPSRSCAGCARARSPAPR